MSELISKDIVDLQDIEKVQFLQTLQSDPAQYSAYVQEKSGRILAETVDTKRASFVKMSGDMARMMDMDHNSNVALTRTNDLSAAQDHILNEQKQQYSTTVYNKDMTRRQVEINNWYYENKRETLFVLQLILLVMLSLVVILGCTSYGWISQMAAEYMMGFIIVVGAGTWMYRWYYTANIRDPRYWNQRRFPEDGNVEPPSGQICIGSDGETKPVAPPADALPSNMCLSQEFINAQKAQGKDVSGMRVCDSMSLTNMSSHAAA
jgi:hypothetical protein